VQRISFQHSKHRFPKKELLRQRSVPAPSICTGVPVWPFPHETVRTYIPEALRTADLPSKHHCRKLFLKCRSRSTHPKYRLLRISNSWAIPCLHAISIHRWVCQMMKVSKHNPMIRTISRLRRRKGPSEPFCAFPGAPGRERRPAIAAASRTMARQGREACRGGGGDGRLLGVKRRFQSLALAAPAFFPVACAPCFLRPAEERKDTP